MPDGWKISLEREEALDWENIKSCDPDLHTGAEQKECIYKTTFFFKFKEKAICRFCSKGGPFKVIKETNSPQEVPMKRRQNWT